MLKLVGVARQNTDSETRKMWKHGHSPAHLNLASCLFEEPSLAVDSPEFRGSGAGHQLHSLSLLRGLPHAGRRSVGVDVWGCHDPVTLDQPAGNFDAALIGFLAIIANDREEVLRSYRKLEPIADRMAGAPWHPLPVTHFVLGRLDEYLGNTASAQDHFVESRRLHERYGSPLLVALSEQALAQLA